MVWFVLEQDLAHVMSQAAVCIRKCIVICKKKIFFAQAFVSANNTPTQCLKFRYIELKISNNCSNVKHTHVTPLVCKTMTYYKITSFYMLTIVYVNIFKALYTGSLAKKLTPTSF